METIKEGAEIYYQSNEYQKSNSLNRFENIFKAGVEFAQRWISVEDELPNTEGEANRLSKVVIAKCEDLADEVSAYYDTITKDWRIYPSGQIIKATNWRPIELK